MFITKNPFERCGGNCNNLAKAATNLMNSAQIKIRKVQEINIQTKSDRRQASDEGLVNEKGNRLSVFGLIQNYHVWIEVYDQNTNHWVPADPSLGLAGLDSWMKGKKMKILQISGKRSENGMIAL